jgi:hypothetical protein
LQQKCVGAKGDDWGSFDAGVFSLGKQNDLLLFFEVPEQYNFFFLRFVLHSKGKAVFSNTQLRQVFFEIE